MKVLYKNTTALEEKNLYDVYKVLMKPIRMMYLYWCIFCIIISCIEFSLDINRLWIILVFLWSLLLCLWAYFSVSYKKQANRFVEQEKSILNVDKLLIELTFYEDKVTQYNPNSKWSIDFFYNKFNEIMETERYFIHYCKKDKNKFFILTDKEWFIKWDSKNFKEFIVSKIGSKDQATTQEKSKRTK